MNVYAAKSKPVVDYDPAKIAEATDYRARAAKMMVEGWMEEQYFMSLADLKAAVQKAEANRAKIEAMPVHDIDALIAFADDVEAPAPPLCRTEDIPDPERLEAEAAIAKETALDNYADGRRLMKAGPL